MNNLIDFDISDNSFGLLSKKKKSLKYIENLSEPQMDEFTDFVKKLMQMLKDRKSNSMGFKLGLRLCNDHLKVEGAIEFQSKNQCIIVLDKFKLVNTDQYLDYLNELKD